MFVFYYVFKFKKYKNMLFLKICQINYSTKNYYFVMYILHKQKQLGFIIFMTYLFLSCLDLNNFDKLLKQS